MRKFLLLFIILLSFNIEPANNSVVIFNSELAELSKTINKNSIKQGVYHDLILALIKQESNANEQAIGDNGRSIGILQIQKCLVDDINRIKYGYNHYTYEDRLDINKSIKMFVDYQSIYNVEDDIEKAARIWNGGPKGHFKSVTQQYWSEVKSKLSCSKTLAIIKSILNHTEDYATTKTLVSHGQITNQFK